MDSYENKWRVESENVKKYLTEKHKKTLECHSI